MRTVKNGVIQFLQMNSSYIYIYIHVPFDADLIMLGGVSENSTCYDVLAGFEWQLTAVCKWHEECLQPTCVCQMTDINSTAFISLFTGTAETHKPALLLLQSARRQRALWDTEQLYDNLHIID